VLAPLGSPPVLLHSLPTEVTTYGQSAKMIFDRTLEAMKMIFDRTLEVVEVLRRMVGTAEAIQKLIEWATWLFDVLSQMIQLRTRI
jgi:hypothetical protein